MPRRKKTKQNMDLPPRLNFPQNLSHFFSKHHQLHSPLFEKKFLTPYTATGSDGLCLPQLLRLTFIPSKNNNGSPNAGNAGGIQDTDSNVACYYFSGPLIQRIYTH